MIVKQENFISKLILSFNSFQCHSIVRLNLDIHKKYAVGILAVDRNDSWDYFLCLVYADNYWFLRSYKSILAETILDCY